MKLYDEKYYKEALRQIDQDKPKPEAWEEQKRKYIVRRSLLKKLWRRCEEHQREVGKIFDEVDID